MRCDAAVTSEINGGSEPNAVFGGARGSAGSARGEGLISSPAPGEPAYISFPRSILRALKPRYGFDFRIE